MFQIKTILATLFFAAVLHFVQPNALACTCGGKTTVLDSFEKSQMVVTAKVVSLKRVGKKEYEDDIRHIESTEVKIEKVYKGKAQIGDKLTFGQGGGGDCIWSFDEDDIGKEILFYLDKPSARHPYNETKKAGKPMYYAEVCDRSTYLEYATNDLFYLNKMEELRSKSRISGTLASGRKNAPNFADLKVKIIGNDNTYEIRTEAHGVYEIYDLPAGEYVIEPPIPNGWKIYYGNLERLRSYSDEHLKGLDKLKNRISVVLKENGHAELDLTFEIDNAIRGKVFSPDGKPMQDVCLQAISTKPAKDDYRGGDCTNAEGEFEIQGLDPGDYILAVNNDGKKSAKEPFGAIFYPGVNERKQAIAFSIDVGELLNDINIQIPKTEELIEVSGRFTYSGGKPAEGLWVRFKPAGAAETGDEPRAETDAEGRFIVTLLKGQKGHLEVKGNNRLGEFSDCAELEKIVFQAGRAANGEAAGKVEVPGDGDIANGKLTFVFSSCITVKD